MTRVYYHLTESGRERLAGMVEKFNNDIDIISQLINK
jgi:DNA-binding PadR family transcriptional regulator